MDVEAGWPIFGSGFRNMEPDVKVDAKSRLSSVQFFPTSGKAKHCCWWKSGEIACFVLASEAQMNLGRKSSTFSRKLQKRGIVQICHEWLIGGKSKSCLFCHWNACCRSWLVFGRWPTTFRGSDWRRFGCIEEGPQEKRESQSSSSWCSELVGKKAFKMGAEKRRVY